MRSSVLFAAATALAGLATASPFERRQDRSCTNPQEWHTCADGWQGCCSVSPCKGSAEGAQSSCPDSPPTPPKPTVPTTTTTTTPAPPASPTPDMRWTKQCAEDNSNCNWNATFYTISPSHPSYARNTTPKPYTIPRFSIQKDDDLSLNTEVFAVFPDIPSDVTTCHLAMYKPATGVYYAVETSGVLNMTRVDLGGASFAEALAGAPADYAHTKDLVRDAERNNLGNLDFGNQNGQTELLFFNNSRPGFDCSGGEVVVHFSMVEAVGNVIFDQIAESGAAFNNFISRAGWVLVYGDE